MTGGIAQLASGIADDLRRRLPGQRKTQREALALLVATMLEARTANLMMLSAFLPRNTERPDMRYQWIARFIANHRVDCDAVMEPFARAVLAKVAASGRVVLIIDQTKARERHQVLMLAGRFGERALPLAWRVAATAGAIGFTGQKILLDAVTPWLSSGVEVCLMADRFYGIPDLIELAKTKGWSDRLRLKANLRAVVAGRSTTLAQHAQKRVLPEHRRTDPPPRRHQHRHHPRSRPRRTMADRDVGEAGRPDHPRRCGAVGHRADGLRRQVTRLWP